MQVLPVIRSVFETHHLLRRRLTFPRQDHCCQELTRPEKCEDAAVIPGICEVLSYLSCFFSNCFTFEKFIDKRRCFLETWLQECFWSTQRVFAPRACSEASWFLSANTNRDWLFCLRSWFCAETRTSWRLARSSLSIKDDDLCRTELPDSRTRTGRPDLCFEEVETLLLWNVDNSLYWPFFSWFLANQSVTLWKESSLERAPPWVTCEDSLPQASAQHCGRCLVQTRRLQTDQLSFCFGE